MTPAQDARSILGEVMKVRLAEVLAEGELVMDGSRGAARFGDDLRLFAQRPPTPLSGGGASPPWGEARFEGAQHLADGGVALAVEELLTPPLLVPRHETEGGHVA